MGAKSIAKKLLFIHNPTDKHVGGTNYILPKLNMILPK